MGDDNMNFDLPKDLVAYLKVLDQFIEDKIVPLQMQDDNMRFFDHRREFARTDFERGGLPDKGWERLLGKMRKLSDDAGHYRLCLAKDLGGQGKGNLWMAVIREHLASKGLGLHNDLQNESSIVGNFGSKLQWEMHATEKQKKQWPDGLKAAFGLTEPNHGSDATFMETTAVFDEATQEWVINGTKLWMTGVHSAEYAMVFARTQGKAGDAVGITNFIVRTDAPGFNKDEFLWTFNMPSDHGRVILTNVRVAKDSHMGALHKGLGNGRLFLQENRIRQAASSLGAAQYCVNESIKYALHRKPFGEPLATKQAIQWPLVELQSECAMLRLLVRKTAWELDRIPKKAHGRAISDQVSMCNYRSNRLVCRAADQAIQTHGGLGYSRHLPFEHIYRHHRRYRITEGSEEIQMRNVARVLFFQPGPSKKWDLYTDESREFNPPGKDRGIWDLDFNSFENTKAKL
jgi:acyl-CoA dehydrogenase